MTRLHPGTWEAYRTLSSAGEKAVRDAGAVAVTSL
jgi:hypothetical protein